MDFIIAHSRYKRKAFQQSIKLCDQMLSKNPTDQAAWILKCQCLIKDNLIDQLQTEQDGLADLLLQDNQKNNLAKPGTSFKNSTSSNPIMRPMSSGRVNTGFQRAGTSLGSRSGTKNNNMLRTGRIMTKNGIPSTSNGRVLRLATASLQQHGQNFFDSSKADLKKLAQRKSKSRIIFQYLFYVQHNLRKSLQLAIYSTQLNNFQDPWWKLSLAKCYYHLNFYPEAEKQLLSSIKHNNNIQSFLYLSKIYKKQDNVEKSINILKNAIQIHQYQPKLHIAIGRLKDDIGNHEQSFQSYQKVLTLENCNIQAVANIASYYYYKDQSEISIKLYQRLIQLGYNSPQIWNNLALSCFSLSQFDTFYTCFEKAIKLAQDDHDILSDIWYNIGNIYSTIGDLDMAIQSYHLSLNHLPDNTQALNNLAVIHSKNNKIQYSINYAQKSFKILPNFQASYNLSIWYFHNLQYQKSYFYNLQTLKLYPNHLQSKQLKNKLQNKIEFL